MNNCISPLFFLINKRSILKAIGTVGKLEESDNYDYVNEGLKNTNVDLNNETLKSLLSEVTQKQLQEHGRGSLSLDPPLLSSAPQVDPLVGV